MATILAYCGRAATARELLQGDETEEARKVLQLADLREGRFPSHVDPSLRAEVIRVLMSRGSFAEACVAAMEIIREHAS